MANDEQPVRPRQQAANSPFGTIEVRRSWKLRKSGVGAADPGSIRSYRFPHEQLALMVALVVLCATVVAAYAFVSTQVAALIVAAVFAQVVAVRFQIKALVGQAAEVTPAQFAGVHAIVRQVIDALDIPPTRVFVVQNPFPNAFSFGFWKPYGIVLYSSLVEGLDEQELAAVIGHEAGHIKFGHTRISLLFGGLNVPLGIPLVQELVRAPFLWWSRCAELSADRAGYAICGRVSKTISSLVKVATGPRLYDQVRPDELARQADEFYRGPWAVVSQLQQPHPFLIPRIQQIVDFAGPPEPGHELNLARPNGLTATGPGPSSGKPPAPGPVSAPIPGGPGLPEERPLAARNAPAPTQAWPGASGGEANMEATNWQQPPRAVARTEAWLAVTLPNGDHKWFQVPPAWMTAGRGQDNDLVIDDPKASHRHFGIQWDADRYTLYDLNSRNGTQVNDQPIREALLQNGDEIEAGNSRLVFSIVALP
jgi:Zn-dependent protease with chaperone function